MHWFHVWLLPVSDTLGISEFDKPLEKAESRVSSAMSDTTSLQNYHFEATDALDSNDSPINSVRNMIGKFESIPQTPTNLNKNNNNNESPRIRKHSFMEPDGATSAVEKDKDGNIMTQMSLNDVVFVDKKDMVVEIFPLLPNGELWMFWLSRVKYLHLVLISLHYNLIILKIF